LPSRISNQPYNVEPILPPLQLNPVLVDVLQISYLTPDEHFHDHRFPFSKHFQMK